MSDAHTRSYQEPISTQGLTKEFGSLTAVGDLTFRVRSQEVFGLLGPNGAGKTTTIRMLSALIAPTSGTATVAGHTLGAQDLLIRRKVGILTESPGLYEGLSAERNMAFFGTLYEVPNLNEQVERYLRMLNLWDRRHETVATYSKGMRQKLAIARALLHEPQILFLDEPTSGLDPAMARLVREFILSLKQEGRTIILSTHNLAEADRLCDRIAVLNTQLIALDTPAALRRSLFGRTVVFHLSEAQSSHRDSLVALPGVLSVDLVDNKLVVNVEDPENQNPRLVRALVEAGADIQFIGELRRTLEDVYLQLVNGSNGSADKPNPSTSNQVSNEGTS